MDIVCGGKTVVLEQVSGSIAIREPTSCPACGAATTRMHRGKEGAVTYCSDPDHCSAAGIYRVKHFIGTSKKGMGILGIGDAVLGALFEVGAVRAPADLYTLSAKRIEELPIGKAASGAVIRLGGSRAASIVAEIAKAKRVPLIKFLGALGIDLLGRRRAEIIAKEQGLTTLDDWFNPDKLATIPGDTIRQSITTGLSKSRGLINDLLAVGVEVLPFGERVVVEDPKPSESVDSAPAPSGDNPFAGKTFCFTGTRAHLDEVEDRGGIIKSGISKALDFLVQKDATSLSNKTKKADSYGVKIIGIDCLEAVLKGERDLPEVGK